MRNFIICNYLIIKPNSKYLGLQDQSNFPFGPRRVDVSLVRLMGWAGQARSMGELSSALAPNVCFADPKESANSAQGSMGTFL